MITRLLVVWFLGLASAWGALEWDRLPDLPDREGFAGAFSGVVSENGEDFLVVAGGANFPDGRPWEDGKKIYYDDIYVLPLKEGGEWEKSAATLPQAVGYGMSASLDDGSCWFMGGKNDSGCLRESYQVKVENGEVIVGRAPSLPVPLAEGLAAVVDGTLIVGAGTNGDETIREFYSMNDESEWETLGWPEGARGRMYAVGGVKGGTFYLFGGRDNADSEEEKEDRIFGLDFLKDAWELNVSSGQWKRLADMPEARSAAPSMAVPAGASSFLMLGGVTVPFLAEQVAARPEIDGQGMEHPGFPGAILSYNTVTDRWAEAGSLPLEGTFAPVTTPVVLWNGKVIIPTGEIKPGVRSPQVLIAEVGGSKLDFGVVNWVVVAVYLLGMVGIGYWFMKRESASTTDAYFRGGQRVPFWVAGLSIFATMLSAITFMAVPGTAYATNWNGYIGQWPILIIVPLVVMFYLPFYRRLNITTAYEYLEKRFNVATRVIGSITFMLFHVGRVAIVLYLPALALSSVTDINIFAAIAVIGVLCVIYTVMGGIEAVVWTDAIQALVLIGGALLCFGLIVSQVDGGISAVGSAMSEQGKGITASWSFGDLSIAKGSTSGFVLFVAFMMANLPSYTSGQDVVQRYVTTPSEKDAARALWMNIGMVLIGSAIFFGLGTALFVFYQDQPELMDPALPAKDSVLPFFIMQNLPMGVAGLIIAGVFAAAQSTISSSLNSVATAFVTDVYGRLLKPQSNDAQRLGVAKWVVIILGLIGIGVSSYLAMIKTDEVFMLFNRFIGFALGPLGGLFALGIFSRRPNGKAGLLALICGVVTVVTVYFLNEAGVIDLMPLLYGAVGFFATLLSGLILGFVMRASDEEVAGLTVWTLKK
ncbi:MAG: sodium/solute symporter [Akkermansiaceae bacterium]|jgi:SSS family solute:Na+ symporter|nr:sodium/solute symporter [Akkermansiaceae bacterium]